MNLTERTVEKLTRQIMSGRLDAKGALLTERVLSRKMGVSRVTIRRALTQMVNQRLVRTIPNKGYVLGPAALAQQTSLQPRDQIMALAAPTAHAGGASTHDQRILEGIRDEAQRLGLRVQEGAMSLAALRQTLSGTLHDHLLGVALLWNSREAAEVLLAAGANAVQVEYTHAGLPMDAVVQDDEGGVEAAMDHLWRKGHRAIGLVAWGEAHATPSSRRSAFRTARLLRGASGAPAEGLSMRLDAEGGREATLALLDSHPKVTALLVVNQRMLAGVLAALEERGLKPRREIELVVWGRKDTHVNALAGTRWTGREFDRIAWQLEDMGRMAVRMLAAREKDPMQTPLMLRLPLTLEVI